jgi:hypothetical protein
VYLLPEIFLIFLHHHPWTYFLVLGLNRLSVISDMLCIRIFHVVAQTQSDIYYSLHCSNFCHTCFSIPHRLAQYDYMFREAGLASYITRLYTNL